MTGMREKDQADFDLDAFIDLFDEALTSDDPSVQKTLQHLMVICALARNHNNHDRRNGPMRRMFENQNDIIRRLERLEVGNTRFGGTPIPGVYGPGTTGWPSPVVTQPYNPTGPSTGTWPPSPGTYPPGTIWAQSSTFGTPVAKSTTSYAYDPSDVSTLSDVVNVSASKAIAERVDSLLKSDYKGSSVGKI